MANNSFKVKNSLNLTPTDPTTITSPQAGDLVCDSTDLNKIKKYNENTSLWEEIGAGGTAGINYIENPNAEDDTAGWAIYFDTPGVAPVDGI